MNPGPIIASKNWRPFWTKLSNKASISSSGISRALSAPTCSIRDAMSQSAQRLLKSNLVNKRPKVSVISSERILLLPSATARIYAWILRSRGPISRLTTPKAPSTLISSLTLTLSPSQRTICPTCDRMSKEVKLALVTSSSATITLEDVSDRAARIGTQFVSRATWSLISILTSLKLSLNEKGGKTKANVSQKSF